MPVITEKVVALGPWPAHGEDTAEPRPEPRVTMIRVTAMAIIAPAMIAGQETAETLDSAGAAVG